ncbi:MAG: hypothetical protein U0R64_04440 [Candidatus Nanopelagicales bacterium]
MPRISTRVGMAVSLVGVSAAVLVAPPAQAVPDTTAQGVVVRPRHHGPKVAYNRWKWFTNTYWIVPKRGIYSVVHSGSDPRKFIVTRGQTVFHITDYVNGYWTGTVVVKLTRAQVPTCQYVLGQITPQGRVAMTMYDTSTGAVINQPTGQMVRKRGKWTMVNTMTAPTSGGGTISHWAYMVQSRKGDRTFRNLPFAHRSIPQFMSACPAGPRIR